MCGWASHHRNVCFYELWYPPRRCFKTDETWHWKWHHFFGHTTPKKKYRCAREALAAMYHDRGENSCRYLACEGVCLYTEWKSALSDFGGFIKFINLIFVEFIQCMFVWVSLLQLKFWSRHYSLRCFSALVFSSSRPHPSISSVHKLPSNNMMVRLGEFRMPSSITRSQIIIFVFDPLSLPPSPHHFPQSSYIILDTLAEWLPLLLTLGKTRVHGLAAALFSATWSLWWHMRVGGRRWVLWKCWGVLLIAGDILE